jgi:general secretion pathway protein G
MRATSRPAGFTLIELLVVLAIIGTLVTIALPKYLHSVERSREAVLRQDLRVMRTAIDQYMADRGHYPDTLDDLVRLRYLRSMPEDPVTRATTTWISVAPPEGVAAAGVYDVRSGAEGLSLDGSAYAQW